LATTSRLVRASRCARLSLALLPPPVSLALSLTPLHLARRPQVAKLPLGVLFEIEGIAVLPKKA